MDSKRHFRWGVLLVECMKQLRADGLPFVDEEVMPNLDGDPNGLIAWFICEHYSARDKFDLQASTEALKSEMRGAGFPQRAIETLRTGVTAQTEIQAGGGCFSFFR